MRAFLTKFLQQFFEQHPVGTRNSEGAGDFPFADLFRAFVDESKDLVPGREDRCLLSFTLGPARWAPASTLNQAGRSRYDAASGAALDREVLVALRPPVRPLPFFAAFSVSSVTAVSIVTSSGRTPLGRVALVRPCLT